MRQRVEPAKSVRFRCLFMLSMTFRLYFTSPVVVEPGYARKQLSLLILRAQSPLGFGGVSLIVCSTCEKSWDSLRKENSSYFHVPDVVDVESLLQADHQPRPVQLHRQDGVAVAVLADLSPFIWEMKTLANWELQPFLKWHTLSLRGEERETKARREEENSRSTIVTSLCCIAIGFSISIVCNSTCRQTRIWALVCQQSWDWEACSQSWSRWPSCCSPGWSWRSWCPCLGPPSPQLHSPWLLQ